MAEQSGTPRRQREGFPESHRRVARTRGENDTIGAEGEREDIVALALQPSQLVASGSVPDANHSIAAGRRHSTAVRMKHRREDLCA